MFVHLPVTARVTARTLARIHHTQLRPPAAILVRPISAIANPLLLETETANPETTSASQMSYQFIKRWMDDRLRWDGERERWDYQRDLWQAERNLFQATDKRQSIMIVELKRDALDLMEEKVRIEQNFNVRGGLERICYQAVLEKKIDSAGGVQTRLDELAKTPEFQKIYRREIEAHGLTLPDVERCRRNIYHELSKHAHGNDGVLQIRHKDFTVNERAAVLAYYKMQDEWKDCMKWEEHVEKAGKDEAVEKEN